MHLKRFIMKIAFQRTPALAGARIGSGNATTTAYAAVIKAAIVEFPWTTLWTAAANKTLHRCSTVKWPATVPWSASPALAKKFNLSFPRNHSLAFSGCFYFVRGYNDATIYLYSLERINWKKSDKKINWKNPIKKSTEKSPPFFSNNETQ